MIDLTDTKPAFAGRTVRFPGIPAIVDGSEAIAHVETRISEVACAYPITPIDDDGRDLPGGRRRRPHEPVGHAARLHRARVRAQLGVGGGGRRARGRAGHELHGRARA